MKKAKTRFYKKPYNPDEDPFVLEARVRAEKWLEQNKEEIQRMLSIVPTKEEQEAIDQQGYVVGT